MFVIRSPRFSTPGIPIRCFGTHGRKETTYWYRTATDVGRDIPYLSSPLYQHCDYKYGHFFDYFWAYDAQGISNQSEPSVPLKEKLSSEVIYLCPHVKSTDTRVTRAIDECFAKSIYAHREASQVQCRKCRMQACLMLQVKDPWAPRPEVCCRLILHVIRYVGKIGCRSCFRVDPRGAMAWSWLMQIDSPKMRIMRRRKELHTPLAASKPDKVFSIRHDSGTAQEWGQCPHW